jgi:CubicO group peptidase (beta-lactamase class C family)
MRQPLDVLGEKFFFGPLGMSHTLFNPLNKYPKSQILPTEIQDWRGGVVQGSVHDESAYVLGQNSAVGSAGLFSTVPDLLLFLEVFLHEGLIGGNRYFSEDIINQIQTNQLSRMDSCSGLGWELNQRRYMGKYASENMFGKTGFTGCSVVCDLKRDFGLVILSNWTYPKRQKNPSLISNFRSNVTDVVIENL